MYKVDRLLSGLTARQKGTTARWYSNKTSLVQLFSVILSIPENPNSIYDSGCLFAKFQLCFFSSECSTDLPASIILKDAPSFTSKTCPRRKEKTRIK